jgi:hypothetical protein
MKIYYDTYLMPIVGYNLFVSYNLFNMVIKGLLIQFGNIAIESCTSDLDKIRNAKNTIGGITSMTGIPMK